jgi:hypothetical protein
MSALKSLLPWVLVLATAGSSVASLIYGKMLLNDADLPPERADDGTFFMWRRHRPWWGIASAGCVVVPIAVMMLGLDPGPTILATLLAFPGLISFARIVGVDQVAKIRVGADGITGGTTRIASIAWSDIQSVGTGYKRSTTTLIRDDQSRFRILSKQGTQIVVPAGLPGRNELLAELRAHVPASAFDETMKPILARADRMRPLDPVASQRARGEPVPRDR